MEYKSKVYVLADTEGRITSIDGGYTLSNITDIEEWTLIDEGDGDRYNLCQSLYLDKPLTDDRGIYRYKLVGITPVERTEDEMDADWHEPIYEPNPVDELKAENAELRSQVEMLEECIMEMASIVYA